ncbi:MAG: (2Fe-2S)-binding protein [Candidatus Marinimicrobia bacterium]|jgi:aerobic carbon-monoxide dehydrogenase small subunit|nr:(2Fe-2S)-binding protein [Candidatus Neomarinimicrobiota bacterium]MBT4361838.1 (2Fe-2S)-binding protein [Candidatus Neomarinimicrobiota bacterium]MBT4714406.1 (2Fe-2S)-binding protein [Candidatus Neomarinimicrobiota bacterium]MBT4946107.1 (2Fe-2S)-binding protein [Candidatus Neomarinimicrobiota bacterium]MBT5268906.1 (2Fe-2S)-binding protein [Candidatus Neomarinimicrobiota bacterium]
MLHHPRPHTFQLEVTINGELVKREIPTHLRLLDFLREDLGLTGSKEVCGEGECGACTVILNGQTVNSCLILAVEVHGAFIITIEGLADTQELSAMQKSFEDHHAVQCGFCIPGMVLTGEKLLERNPHPSRDEIKYELSGNICRCTGYHKIVDAIENAGVDE